MDLVSIFMCGRACVHVCVRNHISDMYGRILFVLGTKTTHDGIHMHIILFHDLIKDGRLAAILVVKKPTHVEHVLNHFSDMHLLILFKLGKQTMNDGLHMRNNFFFEIRSKMAYWRPF